MCLFLNAALEGLRLEKTVGEAVMSHSQLPYFGYCFVFVITVSLEIGTIGVYTVYFCSQQVTWINDQCAVRCLNFMVGWGGCADVNRRVERQIIFGKKTYKGLSKH